MRVLLIYNSVHHGNTEKIAKVFTYVRGRSFDKVWKKVWLLLWNFVSI